MGLFSNGHEAVKVTEETRHRVLVNQPDGYMIRVRPDKGSSSFSGSKQILKNLHNRGRTTAIGALNISEINTFEIWYDQGEIDFRFFVKSKPTLGKMLKQLGAFFPDSEISISERYFPKLRDGEYISGTRFHLKNHYFEPIAHKGGNRDMENDPYQIITNDITSNEDSRMVIQVCLKPVKHEWTSTPTKNVADYGEKMKQDKRVTVLEGMSFEERNITPPQAMRKAANDVMQQRGKPAFFINLRALSIAPTEKETLKQSRTVAKTYESTHREITGQTLVPRPMSKGQMPKLLSDMIMRRGRRMSIPKNPLALLNRKISRYFRGTTETMIMTIPEVTSLAHIPNAGIQNQNVNWSTESIGGSPPVDLPSFEEFREDMNGAARPEGGIEQVEKYEVEWLPPVDPPKLEKASEEEAIVAEELLEGYEDPLNEYVE